MTGELPVATIIKTTPTPVKVKTMQMPEKTSEFRLKKLVGLPSAPALAWYVVAILFGTV